MVCNLPTRAPVHYLTVMLLLSFSAVIVADMAIKPMRTNDEPTAHLRAKMNASEIKHT